jgi:hypothetical protein
MRFIGHRDSRIVCIRPEGHAHVLQQRGAGVRVECRDGSSKRGGSELPGHERLHRGNPHHQDRDSDAHLPEPGLQEEGPQGLCIAEGAYRP